MSKLPPAAKPKWDWDLAFAMYCGGLNDEQIMAHPKFRGMPKSTLITHRCKNYWETRREQLARLPQSNAVDNAAKRLQDRLQTEGITHQEFMLTELERERRIYGRRPKDGDKQGERLQSLRMLDELARRVSRLDEQKQTNPITQGFAVLVHLQTSSGPQSQALVNQNPTISATMIPSGDSEASEGILRSNNAHPDVVEDAEYEVVEAEEPPPEGRAAMPAPGSLFGAAPISKL